MRHSTAIRHTPGTAFSPIARHTPRAATGFPQTHRPAIFLQTPRPAIFPQTPRPATAFLLAISLAAFLVIPVPSLAQTAAQNAAGATVPSECIVLSLSDQTPITAKPMGELKIANPVGRWPEEEMLDQFRSQARDRGANLVKITRVVWASRYNRGGAVATIFAVDSPRKYESWIDWSADRRLTMADFHACSPQNIRLLLAKVDPSAAANFQPDDLSSLPSHDSCDFYLTTGELTKTRFYPEFSWIDQNADTGLLLEHAQGVFDLCECFRKRLDTALPYGYKNFYRTDRRSWAIYRQIYAAYLSTRQQYELETRHGLDWTQQRAWTRRIAAGDIPPVRILTNRQLTAAARSLAPPPGKALVYVIRPNQYNTPFWKRMVIDPYCVWPCPYFLFLNPDVYTVSFAGLTQGPLRIRNFAWQYVTPGPCTVSSDQGDVSMPLTLEAGKTYYVKMKLIERRFCAGAHPEWELLSARKGRRWLDKSKLATVWQNFKLPQYPDQLN